MGSVGINMTPNEEMIAGGTQSAESVDGVRQRENSVQWMNRQIEGGFSEQDLVKLMPSERGRLQAMFELMITGHWLTMGFRYSHFSPQGTGVKKEDIQQEYVKTQSSVALLSALMLNIAVGFLKATLALALVRTTTRT